MKEIKQLCMYCGCNLGSVPAPPGNSALISHGLCPDCLPTFMAGSGQPFTDFLDSLSGPIFVMDAECRVVGANTLGRQLVSQESVAIEGRLGGEVFECTYAKLPGGCGRSLHCKTCTIRNAVTRTAETGESCIRVQAFMDLGDISQDMTVRLLITTEKVNDLVLLRIDEARQGVPEVPPESAPEHDR